MSDGADPEAPVVTVDGPSGTGKGTLSALLAQEVGWHYLDSGALYRAVALAARERGVALAPEAAEELGRVARHLAVHFEPMPEGPVRAFVDDRDVTDELRSGPVSEGASVVAALAPVREGLLALQQASRDTLLCVKESLDTEFRRHLRNLVAYNADDAHQIDQEIPNLRTSHRNEP